MHIWDLFAKSYYKSSDSISPALAPSVLRITGRPELGWARPILVELVESITAAKYSIFNLSALLVVLYIFLGSPSIAQDQSRSGSSRSQRSSAFELSGRLRYYLLVVHGGQQEWFLGTRHGLVIEVFHVKVFINLWTRISCAVELRRVPLFLIQFVSPLTGPGTPNKGNQ